MPDLTINVGFTSNAQSLVSSQRQIQQLTAGFARMILHDVAVGTTEQLAREARKSLVQSVRKEARDEVRRMAQLISNTIAVGQYRSGPEGPMSLKGGMSATAKELGFAGTYYRDDAGITWSKRTKGYMRWKRRTGRTDKWWESDSDLKRDLADETLYLNAFGPVYVRFTPARNQDKARAGMARSFVNSAGGASTSRNLQASITQSGRAGRLSGEYQIGRLEVVAFGKITPAMMPSLTDMTDNAAVMKGSWNKRNDEGLAGLFPMNSEERIKLVGRQAKRRYAIEPFVSYFLTRAIPNAVWLRTEKLVTPSAAR